MTITLQDAARLLTITDQLNDGRGIGIVSANQRLSTLSEALSTILRAERIVSGRHLGHDTIIAQNGAYGSTTFYLRNEVSKSDPWA